MHRSSESIAALAAALAKAQAELVNPEKSLVATIKPESGREAERSFKYASLASGLEIVRKTLGSHEIATVQTTAIDQVAGMVNLTTVLAHASGEWISSDWPVCPVVETAAPHRMGAALTYARRHALFTLVGIAGEDDVDAPGIAIPATRVPGNSKIGPYNGSGGIAKHRSAHPNAPQAVLGPDQSRDLRDRLLADLERLTALDDATVWAQRVLASKHTLTEGDAAHVDAAFHKKVSGLDVATNISSTIKEPPPHPRADSPPDVKTGTGSAVAEPSAPSPIDKANLQFPEPRRVRDKAHLKFVRTQSCLICGRRPADAHHLRFTQPRALSRKASDEFTVPLCRTHHREVHRRGEETTWWRQAKIDPTAAARALWLQSHPIDAHGASPPATA
jgi:hypothetical protein